MALCMNLKLGVGHGMMMVISCAFNVHYMHERGLKNMEVFPI